MRRKTAFTLVELLMVIAIIMVLISMLLPNVSAVRELTRRSKCASNLHAIGSALTVYTGNPTYKSQWPEIKGSVGNSPVGTNYMLEPRKGNDTTPRSVTSLLYILVRMGSASPAHFACPSDTSVTAEKTYDVGTTWDFEPQSLHNRKVVTYSYAAPIAEASGLTRYMKWPDRIAAVSDTSPNVGLDKQKHAWSDNITDAQRRQIVPRIHSNGDMFLLLWADSHVSWETRADIGIHVNNPGGDVGKDCIYTGFGSLDDVGSRISVDANKGYHTNENDSFLYGPNYEK